MENVNLCKKGISLSLALTLLFTAPASATTRMSDLMDMSQTTSPGTWEDEATGTEYHSGGRISFRFPQANSYPLWFDAGAPSLTAGCDGFDLDGGFVSLLGWDRIQDQLGEAGTSALYGVILILVSSTPILGDVIDKIQKWSRMIQQILQNSCEIVKNVGRGAIGGALTDQIASAMGAGDDASWYNETMSTMDGWYDSVDSVVGDMINDGRSTAQLLTSFVTSSPDGAASSPSMAMASSKGVIPIILSKQISFVDYSDPFIVKYPLKKILDNSSDHVIIQDADQKDRLTALFYFISAFYGDYVVSQKSISPLLGCITASGDLDAEKVKALLKSGVSSGTPFNLSVERYVAGTPNLNKNYLMPEFLINGVPNGDTISYSPPEVLVWNLPTGTIESGDDTSKRSTQGIVLYSAVKTTDALSITWGGFRKEIDTILYSTYNLSSSDGNSTSTTSMEFMPGNPYPAMRQYIKVLKRYLSSNNGANEIDAKTVINKVADSIAYYNALGYFESTANMINEYYGKISSNEKYSGSYDGSYIEVIADILLKNTNKYKESFFEYAKEKNIMSQEELRATIKGIEATLDKEIETRRKPFPAN